MTLVEGSGTIRDFSEGIAEENQIETCFGDVRLGRISKDRFQIGTPALSARTLSRSIMPC